MLRQQGHAGWDMFWPSSHNTQRLTSTQHYCNGRSAQQSTQPDALYSRPAAEQNAGAVELPACQDALRHQLERRLQTSRTGKSGLWRMTQRIASPRRSSRTTSEKHQRQVIQIIRFQSIAKPAAEMRRAIQHGLSGPTGTTSAGEALSSTTNDAANGG